MHTDTPSTRPGGPPPGASAVIRPESLPPLVAFLGPEQALRIPAMLAEAGILTPAEVGRMTARINALVASAEADSRSADGSTPTDRYEEQGEIGRGGLGRVTSAYDPILDRLVALKEILRPAGPELVLRFLQEARITGQLEHPAIVPVHELGFRADGAPYYAMKLVQGQDLEGRLKACSSLDARLAFLPRVLDVANAIAYAHSRGVIHRDIKPSNVLVGDFGETIVIDWGLAKVLRQADVAPREPEEASGTPVGGANMTSAGNVLGTVEYMAWEQAAGRVDLVDERADVFALGAMLYRLLTGRPPYQGRGLEALVQAGQASPPPVEAIEPAAPRELAAICRKAMSRDRESRYSNAGELAADLERYQAGLLVGAHRYTTGQLVRRWVRRHRAEVIVAATAVTVLLGLAVLSYVNIARERDAARQNLAQALVARGRTAEDQGKPLEAGALYAAALGYRSDPVALGGVLRVEQTVRAMHQATWRTSSSYVAFAPDGRHLVAGGQDGIVRVRGLPGGEVREVPAHSGEILGLAFSPRGDLLATASADESVKLWRWNDGLPTLLQVFPGHDNLRGMAALPLAFSPDGLRLVHRGPGVQMLVRDVPDGSVVARFEGGECNVCAAAFLPPGDIVLLSGFGCGPMLRWDYASGRAEPTDGPSRVSRGVAAAPDGRTLVQFEDIDGHVLLVGPERGQPLASLPGHKDIGQSAAFSPDGSLLVTSGADGEVRLWNVPERRLIEVLPGHVPIARSVAFGPGGDLIASADTAGTILIWRLRDPGRLARVEHDTAWVTAAAFSPDGRVAAVGGSEMRIVDLAGDSPTRRHAWMAPGWARFDFSPDGRHLYAGQNVGQGTGTIRVFDLVDGSATPRDIGTDGLNDVRAVSVHPRGTPVAVTSGDTVYLWDPSLDQVQGTLPHRGSHGVAFSPDGSLIATCGHDRAVRLWDTSTWETLALLEGHEGWVRDVDFNPDGTLLASASFDGSVRVWDVATRSIHRVLRWRPGYVFSVDFSPADPRWLLATSDRSVLLWDVERGTVIAEVYRHGKVVESARFSPDGRRIVSTSDDHTAVFLDVDGLHAAPADLVRRFQDLCNCRVDGIDVVYEP